MNTGFWEDPAHLANGWECLHNMMPSEKGREIGLSLMDYLHGCCIQFAAALHQTFGYPMYGIWEHDGEADTFVHAFCELPNGDVVDVRGITDHWDAFLDDFDDWIFDRDDMDIQSMDCFGIASQGDAFAVAMDVIRIMPKWYRAAENKPLAAEICKEQDSVVY